jgi:adenylosuccinate synthase
MTVTVVLGTQWGDEGKGKAIDTFAGEYDYVARFNGGNNAGHTIVNQYGTFKIHLVPSGIFHPRPVALIGGGVALDPAVLLEEIAALEAAGVPVRGRLFISPRAHLIMPWHKILDGLLEEAKGARATGTTRRGIGPAFADKVSYNGLRLGDLRHPQIFTERLETQVRIKNAMITALGGQPLQAQAIREQYLGWFEQLRPFVRELFPLVQDGLREGKRFLLEQAMGSCLDTDWGTYPYVTGSPTVASAATTGLGIPPRAITQVVGMVKAYTTRVGSGPLPSEVTDDDFVRQTLSEVAATTGRIRRGGWLDYEVLRFSTRISGVDALFLTKLDILSALPEIKVCTGYRLNGRPVRYFELDTWELEQVEPVYETLPGWQRDIGAVRRYADLPAEARAYVERLEAEVGLPVRWIGVGPQRDAVIVRD